jgi:hypothetical protein
MNRRPKLVGLAIPTRDATDSSVRLLARTWKNAFEIELSMAKSVSRCPAADG